MTAEHFHQFVVGLPNMEAYWRNNGPESTVVTRASARVRRHIYKDISAQIDGLFAEYTWIFLGSTDGILPEGHLHLDSWIDTRIKARCSTRFFTCFVQTPTNERLFLKIQLQNQKEISQALSLEMSLLKKGILPVTTPRLIAYRPGTSTSAGFYSTQVVPDRSKSSSWSLARIRRVIGQVVSLENSNNALNQLEEFDLISTTTQVDLPRFASNIISHANEYLGFKLSRQIMALTKTPLPQVLVHGDLSPNNVLFWRNGVPSLIDWEMAGKGFLGQDAGKLLHKLRLPFDLQLEFMQMYCEGIPNQETRLRGLSLGYIVEALIYIAWRAQKIQEGTLEATEHTQLIKELQQELSLLRLHLSCRKEYLLSLKVQNRVVQELQFAL
jgi:hypothetical protein